jgi:drug/metabolite transporter (DMT)-like permease
MRRTANRVAPSPRLQRAAQCAAIRRSVAPHVTNDIHTMLRPLAMLSLIAAMSLTGANVPFGKAIIAELSINSFLTVRFAIAAVVLLSLVPLERGPGLRTLDIRQWVVVCVLGFVGSVLYTLMLLEGVKRTAATDAGIILAALPAVVTLIAALFGSHVRPGQWLMIVLAVSGLSIIATNAASAVATPKNSSLVGNGLIGLAVLCEATFVLAARGIAAQLGPIRLSMAVSLVSLAACLFALPPDAAEILASLSKPSTLLLVVWYALTSSVICTVLWYWGVRHVEPWAAGLATAALPVVALAASRIVLGEPISWQQGLGAVLVVAAISAGAFSGRSTGRRL